MSETGETLLKPIDPMAVFFAKAVGDVALDVYGDRIAGVKLFGSFAAGTPRLDSDVDIMVVMDKLDPDEWRTVEENLYQQTASHDIATEGLHILPVAKDKLEDPKSEDPVVLSARKNMIDIPLEKFS